MQDTHYHRAIYSNHTQQVKFAVGDGVGGNNFSSNIDETKTYNNKVRFLETYFY